MANEFAIDDPAAKLKRRARLAEEARRMGQLKDELSACPHWPRGTDLAAALDETLGDLKALEDRLETKAVIAVVGGSGTGKSSLVNALCGSPDAVRTGIDRPTTRKAAAVVRSLRDAEILQGRFGSGDLDVVPVPGTKLPGAVLIDAPDTDSAACADYAGILDRVLENADILVCVFHPQNPKRKDNLDRLRRFVAKFPGKHVVPVLNHADLIPAGGLEEDVVPDFKKHLEASWPGRFSEVFCTVATVAPDALAGGRNDLGRLHAFLAKISGKAFVDERVGRAAFLREKAEEGVREAIRTQGNWTALVGEIRNFECAVSQRFADRYADMDGGLGGGEENVALLREVAPRWWGPMGCFLGLSLRARRFAGIPFRLSDVILPLGLWRRIRAFAGGGAGGDSIQEARDAPPVRFSGEDIGEEAHRTYIALVDRMVREFGMLPSIGNPKTSLAFEELAGVLFRAWKKTHDDILQDAARRCSGFFFQLCLNACTVVPAGYIFWIVVSTFWKGNYLPGEFYRHGSVLLVLIWLLTAWFLQICLSRVARSIRKSVAARFRKEKHAARVFPVASEIERLERLARS